MSDAAVALLADENFNAKVARRLARQGYDVVTVAAHRTKLRAQPDVLVLRVAMGEGRAVLTYDEDLRDLHARTLGHSGILLVGNFPNEDAEAVAVAKALHRLAPGELIKVVPE